MAEITYRLAVPEDARRLAETRIDMLLEEAQAGGRLVGPTDPVLRNNEEYFADRLADGSVLTWLAFDGGALIGTGSVNFSVNPPNFHAPSGQSAYIANIYTVPDHRGCGIATEILRRCVDSAREQGCERVTLNASQAGRPIYEKYGFTTAVNAMSYYPKDHEG